MRGPAAGKTCIRSGRHHRHTLRSTYDMRATLVLLLRQLLELLWRRLEWLLLL